MIVDWAIHHGNGTQKVFYEDPRVLYIRWDIFSDSDINTPFNHDKEDHHVITPAYTDTTTGTSTLGLGAALSAEPTWDLAQISTSLGQVTSRQSWWQLFRQCNVVTKIMNIWWRHNDIISSPLRWAWTSNGWRRVPGSLSHNHPSCGQVCVVLMSYITIFIIFSWS